MESARREYSGSRVSHTVVSLLEIPRPPSPRTARSMTPTQLWELSRQYKDLAHAAIRARGSHSDEVAFNTAPSREFRDHMDSVSSVGGANSELVSHTEKVSRVNPEAVRQDRTSPSVGDSLIQPEGQFPEALVPSRDVPRCE